jgi:hypothetical protein
MKADQAVHIERIQGQAGLKMFPDGEINPRGVIDTGWRGWLASSARAGAKRGVGPGEDRKVGEVRGKIALVGPSDEQAAAADVTEKFGRGREKADDPHSVAFRN